MTGLWSGNSDPSNAQALFQLLFAVLEGKRTWLQTSRKSFVTLFQEKAIATLSFPILFKGIVTIPGYIYI